MSIGGTLHRPPVVPNNTWQERAACRNADPRIFEVNENDTAQNLRNEMAKEYCRVCPRSVFRACDEFAATTKADGMIYAGKVRHTRRRPEDPRPPMRERPCIWCGDLFAPVNSASKYCGQQCVVEAKAQRVALRARGLEYAA